MPAPADDAVGPAPVHVAPAPSARRAQTAIDGGVAFALAMLAWPFPLARSMLTPVAHVASVFLFWYLMQIAYSSVTMAVWGATAGTRLMGFAVLSADGTSPGRRQRLIWGAISGAMTPVRAVVPPRVGERDVPDAAARVEVVLVTSAGR